jgi:hypothetical protein
MINVYILNFYMLTMFVKNCSFLPLSIRSEFDMEIKCSIRYHLYFQCFPWRRNGQQTEGQVLQLNGMTLDLEERATVTPGVQPWWKDTAAPMNPCVTTERDVKRNTEGSLVTVPSLLRTGSSAQMVSVTKKQIVETGWEIYII